MSYSVISRLRERLHQRPSGYALHLQRTLQGVTPVTAEDERLLYDRAKIVVDRFLREE